MNYRTIQLTNKNIGAVSVDALLPLGTITRKVCSGNCGTRTFEVTTSGADTIILNEKGYYDVVYNASLVAGAEGIVGVELLVNGTSVYTSSASAASGETVNINVPYTIRVFDNCQAMPTNNPVSIQLKLVTTAISSGTSNLSVTRVY